jgi:hypothetical protein
MIPDLAREEPLMILPRANAVVGMNGRLNTVG